MKQFFYLLMSILGLTSGAEAQNITSVDAPTFQQAILADTVQLVDVRTAAEFAEGHIAYAQNIDYRQSDFKQQALAKLDKSRTIYIYCRSGHRSMAAAEILAKEGFVLVNLKTGILGWPYEVKK